MSAELFTELGWDSPAHALVLEYEFERCSRHRHAGVRQALTDLIDIGRPCQSTMYKALLAADYDGRLMDTITSRIRSSLPCIFQEGIVDPAVVHRAVATFC